MHYFESNLRLVWQGKGAHEMHLLSGLLKRSLLGQLSCSGQHEGVVDRERLASSNAASASKGCADAGHVGPVGSYASVARQLNSTQLLQNTSVIS
jgi:hypothetical protein